MRALTCASNRLFSTGDDKSIKVWEMVHHTCVKTLRGGGGGFINALIVARGRLVSGGADKVVRVWE